MHVSLECWKHDVIFIPSVDVYRFCSRALVMSALILSGLTSQGTHWILCRMGPQGHNVLMKGSLG